MASPRLVGPVMKASTQARRHVSVQATASQRRPHRQPDWTTVPANENPVAFLSQPQQKCTCTPLQG
eukprot:2010527-Pleurochrysis_carterae.AAC.1